MALPVHCRGTEFAPARPASKPGRKAEAPARPAGGTLRGVTARGCSVNDTKKQAELQELERLKAEKEHYLERLPDIGDVYRRMPKVGDLLRRQSQITPPSEEQAPTPTVRIHSTKGRRAHWLDAVLKTAQAQATDPHSAMSVWHALCALAASPSPPEPLIGMLGRSIKRRDGASHELFNYDGFVKYWNRRQTPGDAA